MNWVVDFLHTLRKSCLHLIYPMKCLHCEISLDPESPFLCGSCASLLELIDPQERCETCFNFLFDDLPICSHCSHYPSLYQGLAASFNYEGPAATLVKRLKYANQSYLSRGMAAFLFAQWEQLNWPLPDVIVPVPLSFSRWLERGYNQSFLLAKEFSHFINRPVWKVLKRKSGDFSQAALSLEQRKTLEINHFYLDSRFSLKDKIVLVIDDVMTSGLTLHRCAENLEKESPQALYALTFCRTLPRL